jgi:uncharacterized protein
MIRVVLDANIFVSAVLKPASNPGRMLKLVRAGKIKLLASADILAEVEAVLLYPKLMRLHRRSPKWIKKFVAEVSKIADVTAGRLSIEATLGDPADTIYLVCAAEGQADFVVSGDRHLKDLEKFQGIPIVSPAEFLSVIASELSL